MKQSARPQWATDLTTRLFHEYWLPQALGLGVSRSLQKDSPVADIASKVAREAAIEIVLVGEINLRGGLCLKWVSPSTRGVPDRIVLMPGGRTIYVELKSRGGRLSPPQRRMHTKLRDMGFRVEVLWTIRQVNEFVCSL